MNRTHLRRLLAASTVTSLVALSLAAGPVGAGNTRLIDIGTTADGVGNLPVYPGISAGETLPTLAVYVTNNGGQTLNNVVFQFGQDGLPSVDESEPYTPILATDPAAPVAPIDLPTGVTVSGTADKSGITCTSGYTSLLSCTVGQLRARTPVTFTISWSIGQNAAAGLVPLKARVTVAEVGNDNTSSSNNDTFAAEGSLTLYAYSCDAVTAYRPGNADKTVSTCTGTANLNGQSSTITYVPKNAAAHSGTIALTEQDATTDPCVLPEGTVACYGYTTIVSVPDDTTDDVIVWTMNISVGTAKVNLQKLAVYHYSDGAVDPTVISLAKSNACSTKNPVNCGAATLLDGVLTVTFKTPGNGSGKVYGY